MLFTIGRNPDNDIPIDEDSVSGTHCSVSDDDPKNLIIEDLDSTNYTRINGTRIKKGVLRAGDKLTISDIELDFEWITHQILLLRNRKRKDFTSEFLNLQVLYDKYQDKLKRIDLIKNVIISIVNICIIGFVGYLNIVYFKGISDADKYAQIATSVLLIICYIALQVRESIYDKEKDEITKKFNAVYRCPRCDSSLKIADYTSAIKGNICPGCMLKFK